MTTCESGGEKFVALSSSSASRWTRSLVGATDDGGRGRRLHDDPLVLLDLRHGGAQDVDQRHRRHVALGEVGAGEDQQVLAVAPHAGGEVVELEQVGQLVGVLLVALQLLDELQLALDEAPGCAGRG